MPGQTSAWLDVLKPEDVAQATGGRDAFTRAVREGNRAVAEKKLKELVELALALIRRAGIGPQD